MEIDWHKPEIDFYVDLLAKGQHFSMAGFSDAEWYSILNHSRGKTGLGQIMNPITGKALGEVIKNRPNDPDFFLAIPDCFWEWEYFTKHGIDKKIDKWLIANRVENPSFYEREKVTDRLAVDGKLYSFINQLQKMPIRIVGNKYLRALSIFKYDHFTEISSPNCHMEKHGVENAVQNILDYGVPGVYLVSAGMSAALIIDQVHGRIPDSWFIDVGSMWDAFVGIGAQRKWRRFLYSHPEELAKWKNANLTGADYVRAG